MARRKKRSANDIAALLFKALLSSGVLAVLASLSGLMYRAGWLNRFGVDTDLFLPQSAAEISFWTFMAISEAWARVVRTWREHFWWLPAVVVAALLVGAALALISIWIERRPPLHGRLLGLWRNKWTGVTVAFSGTIVMSAAIPWLVTTLSAIPLLLPWWTFSLGEEVADRSIAAYNGGNTKRCSRIEGPAGELAGCALVVAQTKEWIAFMKGDQVHIVPSEGIRLSARRPDAKSSG